MTNDPLDAIEMRKAIMDLAELVREYYKSLLAQGFSKREAMELAIDYQRACVGWPAG